MKKLILYIGVIIVTLSILLVISGAASGAEWEILGVSMRSNEAILVGLASAAIGNWLITLKSLLDKKEELKELREG